MLYVDPAAKRVGLTLQRHLLAFSLPPNFPMLGQVGMAAEQLGLPSCVDWWGWVCGVTAHSFHLASSHRLPNRLANCCLYPLQIFESAVVRRVDEGLGLLCELPAEGQGALPLAPGYAHISNLADSKVEDLSQVGGCSLARLGCIALAGQGRCVMPHACVALRNGDAVEHTTRCAAWPHLPYHPPRPPVLLQYRTGQRVRARVLGFRPMDGLAVLSMKPSVVDQSVASVAGEQ